MNEILLSQDFPKEALNRNRVPFRIKKTEIRTADWDIKLFEIISGDPLKR